MDSAFYLKPPKNLDPKHDLPVPKDVDPGHDARPPKSQLGIVTQWDRLIADGDWAVKEYWGDFNDGFLNVHQNVTPDRIRQFMAYLVRLIDGETNPAP